MTSNMFGYGFVMKLMTEIGNIIFLLKALVKHWCVESGTDALKDCCEQIVF